MTTTPTELPHLCSFGPLSVTYDDRVLTPRAWTLLQSHWAAELAADAPNGPILELCAGAGQIGQAAALLCGRRLVQVELDPVAARYARINAVRAGLGDRVDVRQRSLHVAVHADEMFPLVIADPPYLPSSQLNRWPDDPVSAIDGGADGLDLVRGCLQVAANHMTNGAVLLLQVAGDAQTQDVVTLASTSVDLPLEPIETRRHDAERAVIALRRG